jgi:hypothetical protein
MGLAMPTEIERIRDLKTSAKNQRDRGSRGYPRALSMLQEAITIAQTELKRSTVVEYRGQLAAELSDCFGLVGGIQRRWAEESSRDERAPHLKASIRAYDEGFKIESDPQYGIVNSYNLVNRLVVRILLMPDALVVADGLLLDPEIAPLNLTHELEQASTTIRQQLAGPRRGDYWAMADLALLEVLLGHSRAAVAYSDFIGTSPPDFAYTSALANLRPLAKLPLPCTGALNEAVDLLDVQLQRLRA